MLRRRLGRHLARHLAGACALFALAPSAALAKPPPSVSPPPVTLTQDQWPLVWADEFRSVSIREGGPTVAGYAAGKGTWRSASSSFTTDEGSGSPDFAQQGFFVNEAWSGWPADYHPHGQWRFPRAGLLIVRADAQPASVVALNKPALIEAPAVATSYLINQSPTAGWYGSNGGSQTTGTAVDGLPAPAVITNSNDYGGVETCCSGTNVVAGTAYTVRVFFNFGSSGVVMSHASGSVGAFVRVTSGGAITVGNDGAGGAAEVSNVSLATVANHKELTYTWTPAATAQIGFRVGPGSNTASTTVSVYRVDVINPGGHPQLNRALVAQLDSSGPGGFSISAPYKVVWRALVNLNPNAWQALWLYSFDGSGSENDIVETFPDVNPFYMVSNTHWNSTSKAQNVAISPPSSSAARTVPIVGQWADYEADVTATDVTYRVNGVVSGRINLTASNPGQTTYYAGLLTTVPSADGFHPAAPMEAIMDIAWCGGGSYCGDPPAGGIEMDVASVRYYAPPTNTSARIPPAPPIPALVWRAGFAGGAVPVGTASGVPVADLYGASSYALTWRTAPHFAVSGSTLVTSGAQTAGAATLYLKGYGPTGVPAFAPDVAVAVQ